MTAPGMPVTVEGLHTNDTYIFAIAVFDEAGALLGELGTSSPEILAGLPLPLYQCWAQLLLMASRCVRCVCECVCVCGCGCVWGGGMCVRSLECVCGCLHACVSVCVHAYVSVCL